VDKDLYSTGTWGPWVFTGTKKEINLVDVVDESQVQVNTESQNPGLAFQENFPDIVFKRADWRVLTFGKLKPEFAKNDGLNCHPKLVVNRDSLNLETDCPMRLHRVKFSFNPALTATNGTPLYAIDPGFIALVPASQNLTIKLGDPVSWRMTRWISIFSILILLLDAAIRKTKAAA
jgi:hypothetical protein